MLDIDTDHGTEKFRPELFSHDLMNSRVGDQEINGQKPSWAPEIGDTDNDGLNELLLPIRHYGLLIYKTSGIPSGWSHATVEIPEELQSSGSQFLIAKTADLDPQEHNGNEIAAGGKPPDPRPKSWNDMTSIQKLWHYGLDIVGRDEHACLWG